MKFFILGNVIILSALSLVACDKLNQQTTQDDAKSNQAQSNIQKITNTPAPSKPNNQIEQLANTKIAESVKFLNEESRRTNTDANSDDYFKYALNSKNIIKSDLNSDGKPDYIVEASFCEETNCHPTTMSYELLVFTSDQQGQVNFMTNLNLGLDAKITNVTKDGIITIENRDYAESDPSCCPSIIHTQSYALVGKKLAQLAS